MTAIAAALGASAALVAAAIRIAELAEDHAAIYDPHVNHEEE